MCVLRCNLSAQLAVFAAPALIDSRSHRFSDRVRTFSPVLCTQTSVDFCTPGISFALIAVLSPSDALAPSQKSAVTHCAIRPLLALRCPLKSPPFLYSTRQTFAAQHEHSCTDFSTPRISSQRAPADRGARRRSAATTVRASSPLRSQGTRTTCGVPTAPPLMVFPRKVWGSASNILDALYEPPPLALSPTVLTNHGDSGPK